jgi:hypothetical protein
MQFSNFGLPSHVRYEHSEKWDILSYSNLDANKRWHRPAAVALASAFVVALFVYIGYKAVTSPLATGDLLVIGTMFLLSAVPLVFVASSETIKIGDEKLIVERRAFGWRYSRISFSREALQEIYHDQESDGESFKQWICLVCPDAWLKKTWIASGLSREVSVAIFRVLGSRMQQRGWTTTFRDPQPPPPPLQLPKQFTIRSLLIATTIIAVLIAFSLPHGFFGVFAPTFFTLGAVCLYYGLSNWRSPESQKTIFVGIFLLLMAAVFLGPWFQ